jgi:hypothetical protein
MRNGITLARNQSTIISTANGIMGRAGCVDDVMDKN